MADLRTKLSLDGSDFGKTLSDATKQVGDFQKKTEDASKSVNSMGQASSRTASELLKQMKSMENLGRSAGDYRGQLVQITRQIQDLTVNYRNMSDEMKNSEFGKEVAAKIDELTVKAGEYKDAIMDAQASVKALSSDTAGWDAMKGGIEVVSSSLQTFTAMGILGANTTEKLVAVLAKLKAIEAGTNAIIKIGNALQKQSALMMGIAKVQAIALAHAKALETTATKGATIAQAAFNKVAKANPYVLLASVIIAAGAALFAYATKAEEAKKKEEELQKETQRLTEKFENFKSKMSTSVGTVVGQFVKLQAQWKNLRTEADKKKWIDDNAEAFRNLGLKVTDVNSADKIFVEQSEAVIAALKTRAEATAALELYTENYKKVVEAQIDADERLRKAQAAPTTRFTAGSITGSSIPEEWREAGLDERGGDLEYEWGGGQGGAGWWTMTEQGAQKYYDFVRQQGQAEVDRVKAEGQAYYDLWRGYEEAAEAAANKVQGLMTNNTNGGSGGNNGGGSTVTPTVETPQEIYDPNSLKAAQQAVTDIQNRLSGMDVNDGFFNYWVEELDLAKARVKEIQDMMSIPTPEKPIQLVPPETGLTLKAAQDEVSRLQTMLRETAPNTEEFNHIAEALRNWQDALDGIQAQYDAVTKKAEEAADATNEIGSGSVVSNINNIASTLGSMNSSIASLYTSWRDLGKNIEDTEDPLESIFNTFGLIFNTMSTITGIMETINSLSEIFNTLSQIGLVTQEATNVAKTEEATEEAALTGIKATNATIDTVGAAAAAGKSAAQIPYVGWILAIGAVAAIVAAIAASKSSIGFAKGGIVPGTSFSGDNVSAQLNSGEMVLTQTQQKNLFNLLDGGAGASGSGGKVEFVIKGQELKGVLNNYDKKMSRV